jgi:hypothetical protein
MKKLKAYKYLTFSHHMVFDTSRATSYAVSIADLNLDGYHDIVIANSRAPNTVFMNHPKEGTWDPLWQAADFIPRKK